jgi:hypothetical protein
VRNEVRKRLEIVYIRFGGLLVCCTLRPSWQVAFGTPFFVVRAIERRELRARKGLI